MCLLSTILALGGAHPSSSAGTPAPEYSGQGPSHQVAFPGQELVELVFHVSQTPPHPGSVPGTHASSRWEVTCTHVADGLFEAWRRGVASAKSRSWSGFKPRPAGLKSVWFFSLRPAAPGARVPAGPGQRAPLRSALVCLTSGGAPGTPGQSGAGAWGGNYRRLSQHPTLVPGVRGPLSGGGRGWRGGGACGGWGLLSAELLLPGAVLLDRPPVVSRP